MNTPNTPKLLIKLIKYIMYSLFLVMEISIFSYGEELNKTDPAMLDTFIRDNHKLEVYAAALGVDLKQGDDPVLARLPFRGLYHKLQNKLLSLAVTEAQDALSKEVVTDEMQKVMNSLITEAGGGFDRAILAFREKFKAYPNTSDLVSLTASSIYDAKEIAELSSALDRDHPNDKAVSREFLTTIFAEAIDNYKKFVKNNEDALQIISKLADDDFKFEDITLTCKTLLGHESCKTEESIKAIKNFSEIMPYVIKIQEEKAMAPSSSS